MGRRRSGFTLIELLVVITIIGLLASAIVVVAVLMKDKAKAQKTTVWMGQVKGALLQYHHAFGHYPQGSRYVDASSLATLDAYGGVDTACALYVLWQGWGRDTLAPYEWGVLYAPEYGKITVRGGPPLELLDEKKFSYKDSTHKWMVDGWGTPIRYGIWYQSWPPPVPPVWDIDPYFLLISAGSNETFGDADDLTVKGMD